MNPWRSPSGNSATTGLLPWGTHHHTHDTVGTTRRRQEGLVAGHLANWLPGGRAALVLLPGSSQLGTGLASSQDKRAPGTLQGSRGPRLSLQVEDEPFFESGSLTTKRHGCRGCHGCGWMWVWVWVWMMDDSPEPDLRNAGEKREKSVRKWSEEGTRCCEMEVS